jgi:predicted transcriptional regulator
MREIAVRLGVTEANVGKNIAHLAECGLIARTKVNGRNTYEVNAQGVNSHPDIVRYASVSAYLREKAVDQQG